ncbi:protein unc-13 homolog 4B isoform X2 [Sitodiplosis mosellana]|uniref:protein unc-13 homolog 4B isoform X2 n=1 Tax=Sitodiplosis mosellana TaxID=263140 RepID=UPI00244440D9|nr:protein unc-13 homolog 4B isoform X2 [Sitodiplosis mosellana]
MVFVCAFACVRRRVSLFDSIKFKNTSAHSNGWAGFHQTKPFLDNASNGSKLWLSDSNKPFYRYNTDRNHHEVNKHTKQLSGDHRIRITVNGGDEHRSSFSGDQNQNYNEESESGASVTIVEIDDVQQSNDDTNTPHIIKNTLHVTPPRYINSSVKRYNEKPIDVPEDFERKAYEFRRNELSPFVRNLQPNSQRQRKNSPAPRIPIKTPKENTTETMGNGCSKNVRRLNKNTVAPNHVASTSTTPIIAHYAEPIKLHSTHSLANKSINEVTPSTSTSTSSNRRVQNTTPRLELYHTHIEKTDARNTQSSSNFDSEAFNLASCIDTKSIIFDKSETKATKPLCVRSSSVDSSSNKSVQRSEVNKFTAHLHRLFRSNQNLASSPTANATAKNEANVSFPKLYRRFSGSVQSLFNSNLNNNRKRNLSASDTNLNRINRCAMTQQQLIDNDYCPSVLYNRKARKSYSEKNLEKTQTFSRWKNQLWLKFSRKRTDPSVPKSIQAIDGGFFEKFGSLLRQRSDTAEDLLVNSHAIQAPADNHATDSVSLRTIEEHENDSGTETLQDTDSEPEDQHSKQEELIKELTGSNTEELYEEILYQILHNVGCETENETCQSSLFGYIQEAFKVTNARHDELLGAAAMKKPPEMRLNVEVIEAKELEPKDPNGLSDPFVTMYIGSAPSHRYNTSVKTCTLNPTWEEHFSLPLLNGTGDESLVIEVWDFDPAETLGEKMTKFLDIKGVRGFRKLMKEIAVTASTGKHDNELIGRCSIPLRTISTSGLVMWFNLDKKNKAKHQGLLKLRLSFSAEKNCKVAVNEHKHLLRLLLLHELESSRVAPYWWSGKFSEQGEAVIAQHSAQSGISANTRAIAQWSAYTTIHSNHALSFKLFEGLLEKLLRFLNSPETQLEDKKLFWEGVKKLLPSCFSVIRNIRKKTSTDKNCIKMLNEVLSILSIIGTLSPPKDADLFSKNIYGWLNKSNVNMKSLDIYTVVEEAIRSGAQDYLFQINEIRDVNQDNDEENLQNVIKVTQLVRADLQRGLEFYDKLFKDRVQCNYTSICYIYYEKELSESFQMTIERACKHLKRISMPDNPGEQFAENDEVNMGTTLFEVYLILKRFAALSSAICPDTTVFRINDYHNWFTSGVAHWLDISLYKALKRIEKAIELDKLTPVDDTVKYSSSAVDTLSIFYQIKIFWQQLNWPDVEGCYTFIAKIVDDICRCCVFYADTMSSRVEGLGNIQDVYDGNKFEVTPEWCLAINNIDYIRQSLAPFIKELKVEEIITKLAEYRSQAEAQRCEETLKNVVENAVDTEENKIVQLIEIVARKMSPPMRKFLMEGAEILHQDSNSMDRLMMYLEDSLKTLNTELNEVNFERILAAIWEELAIILRDLVQTNLDKRRPPQFFSNLRESLRIMVKSFKCGDTASTCVERETLAETEKLLQLHSYETSDLIHQYYYERYKEQQAMEDATFGQLTVRCGFSDDNCIEIEIINARNLVPIASNGTCDPFVRIQFSPEEKFGVTTKYKTNFQNKTLFPLFDEKFVIPISNDQRSIEKAMIMFSVKDRDLLGFSNQYIAECFLPFNEIANDQRGEQVHLKLSRPKTSDCPHINALKLREGDKLAKEFMKKLKQKLSSS